MILREKVEGLLLRSTPRNSKMWAQFGKGLPPITQLDALKWDPNPGVRRGISKLLFLSELSADSNEFDSLVSGKQISNKKTKDVLKGLGWVSTSLRGNSLYDADVTDAINSGALAVFGEVKSQMGADTYESMKRVAIGPLINIGNDVSSMGDYFEAEISAFTDPKKLKKVCLECLEDPTMGGRVTCHWPWILEYCIAIGKSLQDRAQGYGISQLARGMDTATADKIRFWFAKYSNGKRDFSDQDILAACAALSDVVRLSIEKYGKSAQVSALANKWMTYQYSEIKLCTYPKFRPAEVLVQSALTANGINFRKGAIKPKLAANSSTTEGLAVEHANRSVFIKAIGGSKNTHDKAKELAGRIAISRGGFDRYLLVLDGPYTLSEVRLMYGCGWDVVCSLENVARLALSIKDGSIFTQQGVL